MVATYHYNNLNQVTEITASKNAQSFTVVNNIQYLPMGPFLAMDIGNGLHYNANYDNGYRLENYQYSNTMTAIYHYDGNHNITWIEREVQPNTKTYLYDNLDRIKQESGGPLRYSYDKLGNRTSSSYGHSSPIPYTYDSNNSHLLKVGNQAVNRHYDNNGNSLSITNSTQHFTYNKANRMSSYIESKPLQSSGALRAEYFYNGIGQRIYKKYYYRRGQSI